MTCSTCDVPLFEGHVLVAKFAWRNSDGWFCKVCYPVQLCLPL